MVGRVFLGRYEAIRLLGEGGMGRVYLAQQTDLGRQVVVKVMHDHIAADPKFRERFQRETKSMVRLQHPYVVTLYDASLNDPQGPCIVMEYIKGVTLDTLLHRNGRLGAPRVCRLLTQLCEALQAAQTEGIIHRDLKPANLMVVDPDTPYEKIKVMDFGLAKVSDATGGRGRLGDTGADFAVGTPGYISPEQVRGDEVDHRADLYSVGVILFELLTGQLPFSGQETMDVLLAHATEPPPSFEAVGASAWVSPGVEAVVRSCLAKTPSERPASARDLADAFAAAVAGELEPPPANQLNETAANSLLTTGANIRRPPELDDPNIIVHQMEAWMPEAVAAFKLRGFVSDVGGEVVESVPGNIKVRLGGKGSPYYMNGQGPLSWFGFGSRQPLIDMELRLERNNPNQQSLLQITVLMHPTKASASNSPDWRTRCGQVFVDLRGYLMGQGSPHAEPVR